MNVSEVDIYKMKSSKRNDDDAEEINTFVADSKQKMIKLKFGDKFTKKPIQVKDDIILLGRSHIHVINSKDWSTKVLISVGEDFAEKAAFTLK